ncbi:hypothetical protein FQV20_0014962, partial [Eudyptula albosignata]
SFKQSSHLVQHMLVHSGERPYECGTCGRTYNHVSSLIRHRRCHKEATEEGGAASRRFPCGVCQKSFKQSSHLVQHMLVHSGERPYECGTCGRT